MWKAFDNLWDSFDADMKEMEEDNNRRMKNLIDKAGEPLPDGTTSETVREEEVKPDGTRITRVTTRTRSVSVSTKK
jgi:hypothetical protein